MRRSSLRVRILGTFAIVLVVAIGAVAFTAQQTTVSGFQHYVIGVDKQDQLAMGKLLTLYRQTSDPTAVQQLVDQLAAANNRRVVFIQGQTVLADSDHQLIGQQVKCAQPGDPSTPCQAPSAPDSARPLAPAIGPPAIVVFANPVPQLDPNIKADFVYSPVGVVRVALNTAGSPEDQFIGSLSKTLLIATLLGGAVAIFLASILSARILQPVQALTRAALQMERGHLDQRVTVRTTDELGSLAHAFNAMADSVAHAERLRRTMLGDVAHDLRTPLTNIRGYLEAIQDGVVRLSPPVLRVLQDETLLLTRLVDDLQDLAQAEAGQVALECLPVDVVQTLEQAAAIVAPQAQARGVSINVEAPNALPPALADAGRVGQVLRNLLQNAITYTPDGGQVTLRARASECITVEVADTGAGIPPEHLPSVFERFYRVDPSRSRATGGSGLGLAIVRQLVEQQGGHVSVESIVGAGSTFRFTLPLAQASTGPQLARR